MNHNPEGEGAASKESERVRVTIQTYVDVQDGRVDVNDETVGYATICGVLTDKGVQVIATGNPFSQPVVAAGLVRWFLEATEEDPDLLTRTLMLLSTASTKAGENSIHLTDHLGASIEQSLPPMFIELLRRDGWIEP